MSHRTAGIALLAGGLLLIVGNFMGFATLPTAGTSISAVDADEAANYLLAGGFALAAALVAWFPRSRARRVVGVLAIGVIGFFGLFGAITDLRSLNDIPGTGTLEVNPGAGIYVLLIGSVIAIIGAVMTLRLERSESVMADSRT